LPTKWVSKLGFAIFGSPFLKPLLLALELEGGATKMSLGH
jgi:hypothetical protein